jgi:pantothenate kinase-related protein Tda10
VDAAALFLPPGRATRPLGFVVLVRGIPGSGKSWLAQKLRSIEVEHGASPPRILSIDPYFLTEAEDGTGAVAQEEVYWHDPAMEGTLRWCLHRSLY